MLDCSYKYGVHNVCDSLFIVCRAHSATFTQLPQVAIPDRKKLPKKYFSRHCKLESTFPQVDQLPLYSVLAVYTQKFEENLERFSINIQGEHAISLVCIPKAVLVINYEKFTKVKYYCKFREIFHFQYKLENGKSHEIHDEFYYRYPLVIKLSKTFLEKTSA